MQLQQLSALGKSLPGPGSEKDTLTPPKQLLVHLLDILVSFEGAKEHGLLEYVTAHFQRKHGGASGEKHLGTFVRSILRYGKDGSEIYFFAKLVENNTPREVIVPLNTAIKGLKQKHQEIMSRADETFRRVKVSFNEVISGLNKLFKRKVEDYENVGGINLKCRLRDYILKLHSGSNVLECSGLCYLEIVVLEAALVNKHSETAQERLTKGMDTFRGDVPPETDTRRSLSKERPKPPIHIVPEDQNLLLSSNKKSRCGMHDQPFYGFADVLGTEVERMSVSEIKEYRERKEVERKIFGGDQRGNSPKALKSRDDSLDITIAKEGRKSLGPRQRDSSVGDRTFEELYAATQHPHQDDAFLQTSKDCLTLEGKVRSTVEEKDTLPTFFSAIDEARQDILSTLRERKEMALWMSTMMAQMPSSFLDGLDGEIDPYELEEEVSGLSDFYSKFSIDLQRAFSNPNSNQQKRSTERHTIDEYYNKRTKPVPRKRSGKKVSNKVERKILSAQEQPTRARPQPSASKEDSEDDIEGVELVVAEMTGAETANLSQASRKSSKKVFQGSNEPFGKSNVQVLKNRRRENERREREHLESARDQDQIEVEDSQMEFEQHERQVYGMHVPAGEAGGRGSVTPHDERSDDSENETYRKRLLASGYKKGTSANSTNTKMVPRRNFHEPEAHPDEELRAAHPKSRSVSVSKRSKPNKASSKMLQREGSERPHDEFLKRPLHHRMESESDGEGVSMRPRGTKTTLNNDPEEEYSFQVGEDEDRDDKKVKSDIAEREDQPRYSDEENSPVRSREIRKYSQVIAKMRNAGGDEDGSDGEDDHSERPPLHQRIKIKESSRDPSERRRQMRSKSHSRVSSKVGSKAPRQPLSRMAVPANKQPQLQIPNLLQSVDSTKHENLIYKCKKRRMYISQQDFRGPDRNYLTVRQGDIVCAVMQQEAWAFVYLEHNPKKFGFVPALFLALIS